MPKTMMTLTFDLTEGDGTPVEVAEKTLFTYDELDYTAQRKALEWYASGHADDGFIAENITEAMTEILREYGFVPATGKKGHNPFAISWDIDHGGYAAWEGYIDEKALRRVMHALLWGKGTRIEWTEWETGQKKTWITVKGTRAFRSLSAILIQDPYAVQLWVEPSWGYYGTAVPRAEFSFDSQERKREWHAQAFAMLEEAWEDAVSDLQGKLIELARREYDYQFSDEVLAEGIRANEYTFNENGERED